MGIIGDDAHPEWCDTIKEYMHQCVREGLYTSRVHDLIDIFRSGFVSIKYVAQIIQRVFRFFIVDFYRIN
jgi:hypothetical protein